ncbi:TRAP transporter substrate-binding protein [Propionivibrio sp.]|uniref:TRAP transporter substrate-binding protein n=1 Tax=Propionivibrio sp. TaxID=2212460 RepID=UPI0039E5E597
MKLLKPLLVLTGFLFCAAHAGAEELKVKFGYGSTEQHPQGVAAKLFADLVKTKSKGQIVVNTYSSGKLGSDPQMQSSLQGGTLEMMVGPTSNLVGLVQELGLFDLPFLFSSNKEADAVMDGATGKALAEKLEPHGLIGLAYWENGFRHVTNSKRHIKRPEDIHGLKIRVMQNPVFNDTFKALGANTVPLAFTELYTALDMKAVDAQENPLGLFESTKFYEVQKYITLSAHVYAPFIVLASKKWWDTLSDANRKIIREAALESAVAQRKLARDMAEQTEKRLKELGMEVTVMSPEERNRMREAVKPVFQKYAQTIGEDLVNQALADIRKANP